MVIVTSEDGWRDIVERVVSDHGGLDVLVNNAAISIHGTVAETSIESMRKVMAVNHDAILMSLHAGMEALTESGKRHAGGASVINTVSIGSYMPSPQNLPYASSKAAARMLTMCAAKDLGPLNIRVNSVHPGVTVTPLLEAGFQNYVERGRYASMDDAIAVNAERIHVRRVSYPKDLAPLYVYLASEDAGFVTGTAFNHDGGMAEKF